MENLFYLSSYFHEIKLTLLSKASLQSESRTANILQISPNLSEDSRLEMLYIKGTKRFSSRKSRLFPNKIFKTLYVFRILEPLLWPDRG